MLADLISVRVHHLRLELPVFFLACGLEHDLSGDCVLFSGEEVLIEELVPYDHRAACLHGAVIRIGVGGLCAAVREVDGLRLVIDVLVDDDFSAVVVYALIEHGVLALKFGSVEHKCKFKCAVLFFRRKGDGVFRNGNSTCAAFLKRCLCEAGADLFAGGLPHHASLHCILRSGDEVPVYQRIDDSRLFVGHRNLFLCLGIDGRGPSFRHIDGLRAVQHLVDDHGFAAQGHSLEHGDVPVLKLCGVDHEVEVKGAVFFLRNELDIAFLNRISFRVGHDRGDLLYLLISFFIFPCVRHDLSCEAVGCAGEQVLIAERIL